MQRVATALSVLLLFIVGCEADSEPSADESPDSGPPEIEGSCCYCRGYGVDALDGNPDNGDNIKDGSYVCSATSEAACMARQETSFAMTYGYIFEWIPGCIDGCEMSCPAIDPPGQEVWCISDSGCWAVFGGCPVGASNACDEGAPTACVKADTGTCLPAGGGGNDCNPDGGWVNACTLDPADYVD